MRRHSSLFGRCVEPCANETAASSTSASSRDWTQTQIAQEVGVTQMQVSRLINRILHDMRTQHSTPA
jgi:hypothetical protein